MQKSIDFFCVSVVYYNQKEGRKEKTNKVKERIKMTIEERIANAKEKINEYWDLIDRALKTNNDELYDYWLARWAAAREIYEILTGERWE